VTRCVKTGFFTLVVEQGAKAFGPQTYSHCDDYTGLNGVANAGSIHDGIYLLDLTQFTNQATDPIMGGQDPAVFVSQFYPTQAAAEAGIAGTAIANPATYQTQAVNDVVWVRITNSSNAIQPKCYAVTSINIYIEPYPKPTIFTQSGANVICVDYNTQEVLRPLTLEINNPIAGTYTYQWYVDGASIAGATGSSYTVDTASLTDATRYYEVEVSSSLGCVTRAPMAPLTPFAVYQSGPATPEAGTMGYTITNAFTENQII
jgi:hypothetical protein